MTKRLRYFLTGMGNVFEISPDPDRDEVTLVVDCFSATPEEAIYRDWARVGDDLLVAARVMQRGASEQEEAVQP